jgi:hypothetical protein
LCSFFLMAGFVALSYANGRRGASGAFWGGVLLALAACTRLSAGIALPIAGIWLICNRKKVFPLSWVAFGMGGTAVLALGLGTFFVMAPENTHFALFGYHAGRSPGGVMPFLALKVGFVSRFVQAYFVLCAGCVAAFLFRRHHRHVREAVPMACDVRPHLTELFQQANDPESPFSYSFISLLWITGVSITLVHFLAPFPYDDYQVILYPLLSAALAATVIPRCQEKYVTRTAWAVLLICTAAAFSSPVNQSWLIRGRDRIWWKFKEVPDLVALQRVGDQIREELGEGGLLLTQDTYLAVEAGARVPHGMEMGPFSYYPGLSRDEAEQLNLMNREMLLETLCEAEAPIAAFSGYGLTMESPSVEEVLPLHQQRLRGALDVGYTHNRDVEFFGQAHTTLEIFERKTAP